MFGRPLALAGLLGAAVGGPYVLSQGPDAWGPNSGEPSRAEQPADPDFAPTNFGPPNLSAPTGPGAELYESPAALEGPVGIGLEQALDWGIDRNWVYRQWARKSTGLADPELFGVRVPLVTGAGMTDVAGSLTYYFDRDGVLQRIRLQGRTADTSRLVHVAVTRFGMQPQRPASAGDQLFRATEGKKLRGELRTRPEGTLWATSPHTSFDVRFEATRPGGPFVVEPPTPRLDLPPGGPPQVAANGVSRAANGESPILPPRAIVPDRGTGATAPADAAKPAQSAQPIGGPPTPKLPKLGAPTAAPPNSIKPLDGYRPQFRWPG